MSKKSFPHQLYRFLSSRYQNLFLDYKVEFKPRYSTANPHKLLYKIVDAGRNRYSEILNYALLYKSNFDGIEGISASDINMAPCWENKFLSALDIIGLYTMLSVIKPKKYIEIGSGNSTKVAYKAKNERSLNTEIISIDPYPRAEIDALADKIIREPFEKCSYDLVMELAPNDILFVDNSHRILPNSDATVFFLEVLPQLKKGVIVHVHDIFIPYDYPQEMCDRGYSEQYGLAIYLLSNPGKVEILLPNAFISADESLAKILDPLWQSATMSNLPKDGGSFWFRIK